MRKRSIKRGVWRIGGRRRRKQMRFFFPIGALTSPLLGGIAFNLAGPIVKKIIGYRRRRQRRQRRY